MADRPGAAPPDAQASDSHARDAQAWARDWITIWHSEMAALATDREHQETWSRLIALWARAAETALRILPAREPAHRPAGANAAPGPAPAMAAFDARDAAIERLGQRVAELERKLAARDGEHGEHQQLGPVGAGDAGAGA